MDESVVKHFEKQKAGTIRMSDAMRYGIKLRPTQCVGRLRFGEASCALGAVEDGAVALGARIGHSRMEWIDYFGLPKSGEIFDEIVVKNDQHRWTREQIANWLEAQGY